MQGHVRLEITDAKTGRLVCVMKGKNLLVDNFNEKLSHLCAGDSVENFVNRMEFGTGSADAERGDTFLQMPITPIKTVTVDHPTDTTTRFTAYLMEDEANGFPISEAGLICGDDTLVGRKTFAGLVKDSDHIFTFKWTISP